MERSEWRLARQLPAPERTRREWEVPEQTEQRLFKKHYRAAGVVNAKGEVDYDADEADSAEWDAFFEMMDVAAEHWGDDVAGFLRRQQREAPVVKDETAINPSRDVFIDFEMLGARDTMPALLGALWDEKASTRHVAFLLDTVLHPAAAADRDVCRACSAAAAVETIVRAAEERDGLIVSWSTRDATQVHRLGLHAALLKRFDRRFHNGLKDVRRWKNRLYPDAKLPTLDSRVDGHALKAYIVATGFRSPRQVSASSAARWLRQVSERLDKCGGQYRKLTPAAKRSWHRLLQYNRLDCEGLKHVYERATRELGLERAYRNTTFRVNVLGESVDVGPGSRSRNLDKALSLWNGSRWAIIIAYNPVVARVDNVHRASSPQYSRRITIKLAPATSHRWGLIAPPSGWALAESGHPHQTFRGEFGFRVEAICDEGTALARTVVEAHGLPRLQRRRASEPVMREEHGLVCARDSCVSG
jgi:hypothetical protein